MSSKPQSIQDLAIYVSEIIEKESHNILDAKKQTMVVSRIQKRLTDLGGLSPHEYFEYLKKNYRQEITFLLSILTTHHTFFFREFIHFEFLGQQLGKIVASVRARKDRKIRILSCACSKGQEVYSLAMYFHKHLIETYPDMEYEIVGTDIDPESVAYAENGVYSFAEVKRIPQVYLANNWQRGTGNISDFVKVKDHLKKHTKFATANLLNINNVLTNQKFDIIFCRNVFIYFPQKQIIDTCKVLLGMLYPAGYLFTGVCESIKELGLSIDTCGVSIYTHQSKAPKKAVDDKVIKPKTVPIAPEKLPYPSPIRMLVVDDSSSVRRLLSKIFQNDPEFQLMGTANHGKEAQDFLKNNKVDAMTLDIHMPEMDGVQYLEKNFNSNHPRVVVVSSASREDTRYAQKTLELGASDFVEKPALNNLDQRADEIKCKIKMAFVSDATKISSIDTELKHKFTISNPDKKARIFVLPYSQLSKVKMITKNLEGTQPPIFLMFEGNKNILEMISEKLAKDVRQTVKIGIDSEIKTDHIYLCDSETHLSLLIAKMKKTPISCGVMGECSKDLGKKLLEFDRIQLLLEDIPKMNKELREISHDIFPVTSFAHMGTEFLFKTN